MAVVGGAATMMMMSAASVIVLVADDLEVLRGCGIVVGKDSNYGGGE